MCIFNCCEKCGFIIYAKIETDIRNAGEIYKVDVFNRKFERVSEIEVDRRIEFCVNVCMCKDHNWLLTK